MSQSSNENIAIDVANSVLDNSDYHDLDCTENPDYDFVNVSGDEKSSSQNSSQSSMEEGEILEEEEEEEYLSQKQSNSCACSEDDDDDSSSSSSCSVASSIIKGSESDCSKNSYESDSSSVVIGSVSKEVDNLRWGQVQMELMDIKQRITKLEKDCSK